MSDLRSSLRDILGRIREIVARLPELVDLASSTLPDERSRQAEAELRGLLSEIEEFTELLIRCDTRWRELTDTTERVTELATQKRLLGARRDSQDTEWD